VIAIVTGMIATYPVGGVVWDYGQYALGLERLGFETYYLEDTGWETYDPRTGLYGSDPSYGVEYLEQSLRALSPTLGERWHFRAMDGSAQGIASDELSALVASADVFLNVSGGTLLRDEYLPARRKVLVDTDPGWNHFVNYPRQDERGSWPGDHGFRAHDHFFTYAERIGAPGCALPTLGVHWRRTRPPVVRDAWATEPPGTTWTTVMTWDNFRRPIEHDGVAYGTKEREFERVETLPGRTGAALEVAVGGSDPPVDHWRRLGWAVASSEAVSRTADAYRSYVQRSRGELSVAKNVYVATRSGWFSCRSVCYLAAGRPVVLQDTGFAEVVPTGAGLHAFTTLEEAVAALARVESDYEGEREAASSVAREHFDAESVLGDLLARIGL
jgi:hypothetical protein